jgi:hypothetical protein
MNDDLENEIEDDGNVGDDSGIDAAIIKEAEEMGWVPKDKYKGKPDRWVDADVFLDKGKHILPIMTENNKRLRQEVLTANQKIGTLQQSVEASQKAIAALQKVHTEATARAVQAAIDRTKQEIKDARADGDVDAELKLQDKLDDLKEAAKKSNGQPAEPATGKPSDDGDKGGLTPEFKAWQAANPWYGGSSKEDKQKTKEFLRIAEDLRDDGESATGLDFFRLVEAEHEKRANGSRPSASKVASGGNGVGAGKAGAVKSFAQLPAEARAAAEEFVDTLVGPGKAYKTKEEWYAHYAKTYAEG